MKRHSRSLRLVFCFVRSHIYFSYLTFSQKKLSILSIFFFICITLHSSLYPSLTFYPFSLCILLTVHLCIIVFSLLLSLCLSIISSRNWSKEAKTFASAMPLTRGTGSENLLLAKTSFLKLKLWWKKNTIELKLLMVLWCQICCC